MKLIHYAILFLAIGTFVMTGCKEDEVPPTPVNELLIGNWRSFEKKEDGNTQPASEGYRELVFAVDSVEGDIVTISDFEEDGAEITSSVDTWELAEDNTIIVFGGDEPSSEIRKITNDSLIIYFFKIDPLSGADVEHEDSYLKF